MTNFAQLLSSPVLDGRFLLVETLGRGGQGQVFRAYDRVRRREVAIKALHETRGSARTHPLAVEFATWARLRHPHVVRAYELLHAASGPFPAGTAYLVLELVRGLPVHKALRAGHEPPQILEELARRLLRALEHVHAVGLVHRDLKPGNVLVGPARRGLGRVKLTDFGLASESGRAGEPGRISGSIPYVAPETILGLAVDGRADLYGLGVLLYYLAVGELPLDSKSPESWLRWHLQGPPAHPQSARPDLSRRFVQLIAALTARAPDARPNDAAEALGILGSQPARTAGRVLRILSPSERAHLRFAIDDASVGARRHLRLPRQVTHAQAMQVEIASLAAARGLTCVRLDRSSGSRASSLARAVLALLVAQGPHGPELVHSHGLLEDFPLALLSGVPVWDRRDHDEGRARLPAVLRATSRKVAKFFSEIARRRTLVLVVDASALGDPLASAVVDHLRRELMRESSARTATGGLLLALSE